MPNLAGLLAQVSANRDEIIALEQELVRIPSVNSGVMPTGNETAVCEVGPAATGAGGHSVRDTGIGTGQGQPHRQAGGALRQ